MEANVTELSQIVESMQLELDSMGTDMDTLWLMLGAILAVCENCCYAQNITVRNGDEGGGHVGMLHA